ncbi:MAG: dinitrogenase iron-molybdenum cofactor biosynthesis protein [Bacilli bacterium]|nr:dinitrogenase iron-molybdenum cofactor biosynthesis protein [Bacilli bacterium]
MRIAVTYDFDSGEIFQHFGQTQNFLLVDVDGNERKEMIITNGGNSHHSLIDYLNDLEVHVLIAGGMGNHAYELLKQAGIKVFPGQSGLAKEAVDKYLEGKMEFNPNMVHTCDCHH